MEHIETLREALEYARQNLESFWSAWAIDKMRPSEMGAAIDAALKWLDALAQTVNADADVWEPIETGSFSTDTAELVVLKNVIMIMDDTVGLTDWTFPDNIRLCRRAPQLATQPSPSAMVALDMPDSPGWFAFEGGKWEVEQIECEEDDPEKTGELWSEEEQEYYPYKNVEGIGESFKTVLLVRHSKAGETVSTRKSHGPHRGDPILGYLKTQSSWDDALHALDTLIGKWTRVYMPWESHPSPSAGQPQAMEVVPDGTYTHPNWDGNGEVWTRVFGDLEIEQWHSSLPDDIDEIVLPEGWQLMRPRPQDEVQP